MSDILNLDKINSLPHPLCVKLIGLGGAVYDLETICVETCLARISVCGQIDLIEFCMFDKLIDADGFEHEPDEFYSDWEEQESKA